MIGSIPHGDGAEWMLDGLAAKAHFRWVSIEPRLHGLKDRFVLPAWDPPLFSRCALALQCAALASGGPIATQCLAVLFIGEVID